MINTLKRRGGEDEDHKFASGEEVKKGYPEIGKGRKLKTIRRIAQLDQQIPLIVLKVNRVFAFILRRTTNIVFKDLIN